MRKSILILVLVLLGSMLAGAQQGGPPDYVSLWVARTQNPLEFEAVSKRFIEAYAKARPEANWVVAQRIFGEPGTYVLFTERSGWAEFDTEPHDMEVLAKAFGPAQAQQIMRQAIGAVESSESSFLRVRPDLSRMDDPKFTPPMAKVMRATAYWIKPGRGPDFERAVKHFIEAVNKIEAPIHFTTAMTMSGGGPAYWIVTFAPNFAVFDADPGNPVVKAFGQADWDKMRMEIAGFVEKVENYTHVLRPDLSRPPKPYIDANPEMWTPKPPAAKR